MPWRRRGQQRSESRTLNSALLVEVQSIEFPKLVLGDRKCEYGVILKTVSTNICGSNQHRGQGPPSRL